MKKPGLLNKILSRLQLVEKIKYNSIILIFTLSLALSNSLLSQISLGSSQDKIERKQEKKLTDFKTGVGLQLINATESPHLVLSFLQYFNSKFAINYGFGLAIAGLDIDTPIFTAYQVGLTYKPIKRVSIQSSIIYAYDYDDGYDQEWGFNLSLVPRIHFSRFYIEAGLITDFEEKILGVVGLGIEF